jgi:hypothetical protein
MPVNLLAEISANKFVQSIKLIFFTLWQKIPPISEMSEKQLSSGIFRQKLVNLNK